MTKILKKKAVPHIFNWSKKRSATETSRIERARKRICLVADMEKDREKACYTIGAEEEVATGDSCIGNLSLNQV